MEEKMQKTRLIEKRTLAVLMACAGSFTSGSAVHALTQTWKNTGTDFNLGGNWVSGTAPTAGDTAQFTAAASTQPNVSANLSIGNLYWSSTSTSGYDITSTSSSIALTLSSVSTTVGLRAIEAANTSGTNTIDAPLVFYAGLTDSNVNTNIQTIAQADGGTLIINGAVTSPTTSGITPSPSGALVLTSGTTGGITINGQLFARGGGANLAGNLVNAAGNNKLTNFGLWANDGTRIAVNGGSLTITNSIVAGTHTTAGAAAIRLLGSGTGSGTGILQLEGNNTGFSQLLFGDGSAAFAMIVKIGNKGSLGAGTVTFTGNSTTTIQSKDTTAFNGSNVIANNLVISSGATSETFGSASTGNLEFSGSVALSDIFKVSVNNANTKFTGAITGGFGLTKTGTGTLELSSASNAFTGTTTISNGIVNVSGSGIINTSAGITLNGGELAYNSSTALNKSITFTSGKLSGTGTVTAVAATNNNDTVSPGSTSAAYTPGKLTVAASGTAFSLKDAGSGGVNAGGKLAIDLGKASAGGTVGAAGGTWDQLVVTSAATGIDLTNGVLVLTLGNNVEPNDVYYILDNQISSGGRTGTFGSATINGVSATGTFGLGGAFSVGTLGTPGYIKFNISYDIATGSAFNTHTGNDVALEVVAAPEPSTLTLLGFGVGGLLARRRRK